MRFGRINLHIDYTEAGVRKEDGYMPHLDSYLLDDQEIPFKRKAVIICPGGGYTFTSEREGEPIAMQFLAAGIQAFVLWYSVEPAVFPMALMELAESVKVVRDHADEWNIDPDKISVMGFSAGGHLAASMLCFWNSGFLADSLHVTKEEIRPNGGLLCYPVITSGEKAHRGSFDALLRGLSPEHLELTSLEKQVNEGHPPVFLWHTWEDELVPVENSLYYMQALRDRGIPCEAHIFVHGGHGLALATKETGSDKNDAAAAAAKEWVGLAVNWLNNL